MTTATLPAIPPLPDQLGYAVVDEWGRVWQTGCALNLDFGVDPGRTIVPEIAPDGTYRSGESWAVIPPQPSENHVWDWPTHNWVDPRTFSDLKDAKWEEIKLARGYKLMEGVDVPPFGRFDANPPAVVQFTANFVALDSRPADWAISWTRYDNSTIELGREDFRTVALAVMTYSSLLQSISQGLRVAINAATTEAEIDGIHWPT